MTTKTQEQHDSLSCPLLFVSASVNVRVSRASGSSVTLAQGVGGFGGLTGLLGPGSSRPAKRSTRPPQRRSGPSSDDTNASSAASRAWNSSSSFNNSASDGAVIGSSALAPGAAVHGNATTSDGGDLKHLFSAAAAAGLGTDSAQQTAMGGAFDRPRRKGTRKFSLFHGLRVLFTPLCAAVVMCCVHKQQ